MLVPSHLPNKIRSNPSCLFHQFFDLKLLIVLLISSSHTPSTGWSLHIDGGHVSNQHEEGHLLSGVSSFQSSSLCNHPQMHLYVQRLTPAEWYDATILDPRSNLLPTSPLHNLATLLPPDYPLWTSSNTFPPHLRFAQAILFLTWHFLRLIAVDSSSAFLAPNRSEDQQRSASG